MTLWADSGFVPASDNSKTILTPWQQQVVIFAHELRALYSEERETQAALSEARSRLRELTQTHADFVQSVDEEVHLSIATINDYLDMVEELDPDQFAQSAPRICATLRSYVKQLRQRIEALGNNRERPHPPPAQSVQEDSAIAVPAPVIALPQATVAIPLDKRLAMLQAQNLTFARDMRVVYEAQRELAAELQASNRRLIALNRASLRFGTCQSATDLAEIGLQTAQEICEADSLVVAILNRKAVIHTAFTSADFELVLMVGSAGETEHWREDLMHSVAVGAQNIVLPGETNHRLHVPIMSEDYLVGALIVRGTAQALNEASSFLLALAGLMSVTLANVRLYADLNAKQATLNYFVSRLLHAQEEERRRVAIDLHDGLAQTIASANHFLEATRYNNPALDDDPSFKTGTRILKEAAIEVRRVMADLRPSSLDELGLVPTLRGYIQKLATEEGWIAEFETFGNVANLNDPQIENNLFRITQEALTNVKKHAAATRVLVRLQQNDGQILLAVRDWGRGIDMNANKNLNRDDPTRDPTLTQHMGLVGMAERARLLGGDFSIDSQPGTGTLVQVSLPLRQDRA